MDKTKMMLAFCGMFCTIRFFTHFLHTKKASILSELTLFYLYTFSRFCFFFQQILHAFQANVQG